MDLSHFDRYPTVEELLRLPSFSCSRVCGGHAGLDRLVRGVNLTDTPDYSRWLSAGELLITTGFSIAGDQQAVDALLPTAERCGLSGVCIKAGRYLPDVMPAGLVEAADRLSLPLIALPAQARFSDLASAVSQEIARRQIPAEQERREALCLAQLLSAPLSDSAALQTARELDINPEQPHMILRLHIEAAASEKRRLMHEAVHCFRQAGVQVWAAVLDGELVILLACGDDPAAEERFSRMAKIFAAGCPERSSCGIGRPYAGICGLLRADDSARTALQMARAQGISCLTDDPAGVVRMIGSDSPEAAIASYVRDHLAPIFCQESGRRRELLDTLECWFVCFGNQRQMAQLMHLHYNTVAYRLHQLWDILPGGQPEGDARLALQTALYLYRQRPDICKRS